MPTPPAAYARWKSTRSVVTREWWLSPSYVAALMIRLRRVSGPIRPGEKTSGVPPSRTCSTFRRLHEHSGGPTASKEPFRPGSGTMPETRNRYLHESTSACLYRGTLPALGPGARGFGGTAIATGDPGDPGPGQWMPSWASCRVLTTTTSPTWWSSSPRSATPRQRGSPSRAASDYHVPITYGIEPFVSPSTDTFCQHTMGTADVFAIEDARAGPAVRRHRLGGRHHREGALLRLGPVVRTPRRDGRPAAA